MGEERRKLCNASLLKFQGRISIFITPQQYPLAWLICLEIVLVPSSLILILLDLASGVYPTKTPDTDLERLDLTTPKPELKRLRSVSTQQTVAPRQL